MKLKCLVFISTLIVAIQSASIEKRYIPVEIVYDDPASSYYPGVRNLNEKIQLPEKELIKSNLEIDQALENGQTNIAEISTFSQSYSNGVKNLEEKVQLSPKELNEALKHLPNLAEGDESMQLKSSFPTVETEKADDNPELPYAQSNSVSLFKQAEEIIHAGLNEIKENFNGITEVKPNEDSWKKLNKTVQEFLNNQLRIVMTRQENQNQLIQTIVTGFQNFTGNFIQNFQNQRPINGSEDKQTAQPGFGQNFISTFTGGVQQIVNNINNLSGQSSTANTVLGDTGVSTTPQPGNIISNVINSVQQIFSGNSPQSSNLNQSDTGTGTPSPSPNPGGFFQGAINQINQVVSNFIPASSTQASVQGDETIAASATTPPGPIQVIQSIGNQIGSAINQVNPFGQSTKPPNAEGDEGVASTTQGGPVQVIQSISNQIGSVISQVNPFASTAKPPSGSEDEATSPANFIQNVGQVFQNINPFRPQGTQNASNPVSAGVQNVGNQIQQLVGQSNGSNPVETIGNQIQQFGQSNGTNPVESIGNQIQGLVPSNPVASLPVIGGSSTESGKKVVEETAATTEVSKISEDSSDKPNKAETISHKDVSTQAPNLNAEVTEKAKDAENLMKEEKVEKEEIMVTAE